ncbi:hypothetical protein QLL95_gp0396 [Cotonvirus japonicus]|uniref:Uncharacterized protein n=1 Tax=Cotonvirus japonicus TaxID=2811091 RepID=A0ABM7NUH5_9VIRU|nr:hypothetical protein QLL95_gp0396 [Cotonvirus japonicus]BCS83727.1 hypothetical protein [Cotonvirus japonicus]
MRIDDFIDFDSLNNVHYDSIIKCVLDNDHKVYNSEEKILLPEKNETLLLMAKAKNSFLSHKKIKNKYIKPGNSPMNLQIFLSRDNKYYCVNFNYNYIDDNDIFSNQNLNLNFVGIFEKKSGKFFAMTFNNYLFSYLCMSNNKYNIIDYYSNYKSIIKKDPLDIVMKLEDRFNDMYDKIHEEICKNIKVEENSDLEEKSESD